MSKLSWPLVVVIGAASVVFAAGGAVPAGAGTKSGSGQALDLSTEAAVAALLSSIGVDAADLVVQRGLRNYAGPRCPGADWSCTTAAKVVQVAPAGGENRFECGDPALFVAGSPLPVMSDCLAVQQVAPSVTPATAPDQEDNHAECRERDHDRDSTSSLVQGEDCHIVQEAGDGANHALVSQLITQSASGSTQTAVQDAEVIQMNGEDANHSQVTQKIAQSTNERSASSVSQSQNAFQSVCVWQGGPTVPTAEDCPAATTPSNGNNFSTIHQSESQSAKASAPTSTQHQNQSPISSVALTDCNPAFGPVTQPNVCAKVDQQSTDGRLESYIDASIDQDARTTATGATSEQRQGTAAGGIDGKVTQFPTTGRRLSHTKLREAQASNAGSTNVVQHQFAPQYCCATQPGPGGTTDGINIDQRSTQHASVSSAPLDTFALARANPAALQDTFLVGQCETTGGCTVGHEVRQDNGTAAVYCPPRGNPDDEIDALSQGSPSCAIVTHMVNGAPAALCPPGFFFDPETGRCEEEEIIIN
jgi:hypothetical protein